MRPFPRLILPLLIIAALAQQTGVSATTMAFDPSFGTNGKVITAFPNGALAIRLGLQGDGRIVAAGSANGGGGYAVWEVARYTTGGDLDTGFGSNGMATQDFGGPAAIHALVLQSDAKIVVGGFSSTQPNGNPHWMLARYSANGSLDTSFGSGGTASSTVLDATKDAISALALQPDGNILAAGYSETAGNDQVVLARYSPNGSLDPSFGDGGVATPPASLSGGRAAAVLLQPGGKIVVFGDFNAGSHGELFLARYNVDGSLDTTFQNGGIVITQIGDDDRARAMALQSDGKIVVAGDTQLAGQRRPSVARYDAEGSFDSGFGSGGRAILGSASGSAQTNALALQSDGKILLAGSSATAPSAPHQASIWRLDADGTTDTTFGAGGALAPQFSRNGDEIAGLAFQTDGRLLAAGLVANGAGNAWGIGRFLAAADATMLPVTTLSLSPEANEAGWISGAATVVLTATEYAGGPGVSTTYYAVDNAACSPSASPSSLAGCTTYSGPFTVYQAGAHTVYFFSEDAAGNYEQQRSQTIRISGSGPTVAWDKSADECSVPGAGGWCRGTQTAGFVAFAAAGLASPCAAAPGASCTFTRTTSTNGTSVTVSSGPVCDAAGACSPGADAGPYKLDSVAPSLTLSGFPPPSSTGWFSAVPVAGTAAASDATSGVATITCTDSISGGLTQQRLIGGGSGSASESLAVSGDGIHAITCTAADVAGNVSGAETATVKVDTTPPTISVAGIAEGQAVLAGIAPTIGVTDTLSGVDDGKTEITLDGAPYASGTTITALGSHTLAVSAADKAGNAASRSVTFLVYTLPSAGAFVIGDQTPQTTGATVNFWGAQWQANNSLSGGAAPSGFTGFAEKPSSAPPACGGTYTTDAGAAPPSGPLPSFMAVLVSSAIGQSGSTITGNVVRVLVVDNITGYANDPGHAATATVVATVC